MIERRRGEMRIGIVTEYFPKSQKLDIRGGAEACAFNEAWTLKRRHNITILTSRETSTPREYTIDDLHVIGCGPPRPYVQKGSFFERLKFMTDAYHIGSKLDLDVIIGYNFITHPVAWKIGRKIGIPAVARYHDVWIGQWIKNIGWGGILGEILERYNLSRNFDQIIAVSEYTREKLKKYFPAEKISVVHNIIDPKVPEHEKNERPTITCVSRLVKYKRVEDLIKAVKILIDDFPGLKCNIVGTGPLEGYLKKLTGDLGLDKHVKFHGFIKKHEDVLRMIASSHVFCLPSVVEGFGIVIVESMSCGTPFVATRIPPILEASKGKGGLFFKPKNHEDLADKVKMLLEDNELYERLKVEGLRESKEYRSENIGKKLEKILKSLQTGT